MSFCFIIVIDFVYVHVHVCVPLYFVCLLLAVSVLPIIITRK